MTSRRGQADERRQGSQQAVERLLAERQQVLVLFNQIAGTTPFRKKKPSRESVQEFCQLLIDYIAAGHFVLYQRIAEGQERRRGVAHTAQQIYPRIAETTQAAVEFNDKYDGLGEFDVTDELAHDLSELGEHLATRVELEDRLIDELLARH